MYEHYLPENVENILLITVDCLRRDHLELYGYSRRTMPYLTRSIGGGLVVEEAHANSPFTRASLPSLFTSSYPLEGDLFYTIRERPITIYSLLRERGYKTAGFSADLFLPPVLEYGRGFDHYWNPALKGKMGSLVRNFLRKMFFGMGGFLLRFFSGHPGISDGIAAVPILRDLTYSLTDIGSPYPPAEVPTSKAVEWIKRNKDNPFFIWIHYMDVHNPYLVGKDLRDLGKLSYFFMEQYLIHCSQQGYRNRKRVNVNGELRRVISTILEIYDRRISRIDANIGKLVDVIRGEGLGKETVLIFTSDHGQGFLEHGFYSHGAYFYEETLRIPLIIAPLEGVRGWRKLRGYRSHIDIPPTILSLLGERKEADYRGKDMIGDPGSDIVYAEAVHNERGCPVLVFGKTEEVRATFAVKKGSKKYIAQYRGSSILWEELFDLANDPGERIDLSGDENSRQVLDELRSELSSHMRTLGIDPMEIVHRFRSLKSTGAKV